MVVFWLERFSHYVTMSSKRQKEGDVGDENHHIRSY